MHAAFVSVHYCPSNHFLSGRALGLGQSAEGGVKFVIGA
jgi:hypothetical protein